MAWYVQLYVFRKCFIILIRTIFLISIFLSFTKALPTNVVQILLVLYDLTTDRLYIYALADDKVSFLRCDDKEFNSWKHVTANEYSTVRQAYMVTY